jgi:hypothetical protein
VATLPSAAPATATGGPAPIAPVAAPVDQNPPEVGLRPPTDATAAPADRDPSAEPTRDATAEPDADADRERGPVVRSESA